MVYVKAGPAAKAGPVAKAGPSRHFGGSADPFDPPPPWLRPCTNVRDTIHADSLALFEVNIDILLVDVTKPEKSNIFTLT